MAITVTALTTASTDVEGTTLSVLVPSGGVVQGSRVVVCFGMPTQAGAVSCADARGNVYAVDAEGSALGGFRSVALSAPVTTALQQNDSITITCPTAPDRAAVVLVVAGLANGGELDQYSTATDTSNTPSAGTIATTVADEALIAFFSHSLDGAIFTQGTGWTLGFEASSVGTVVNTEYRVVAATGSYVADGAYDLITQWSGVVVSYQATSPEPPAGHSGALNGLSGLSGLRGICWGR